MKKTRLKTADPKPKTNNDAIVSICPKGEAFSLPQPGDYEKEFKRLKRIVKEQRLRGREIVVVMGVGFVGAVMAGVVADAGGKKGTVEKFVIGMQRPSSRSYWKIPYLNRGIAPVEAEDPEVAPMIRRCVKDKKNLIATFTYDVLSLADVVIVDVQCDYHKETFGDVRQGHADIAALEECLRIIGEKIEPGCLVLIETTVPPGTTEYVAYPIIKKEFERRGLTDREPLLSHSFERVMPGRNYVASIRDFWRVCSGINAEARERVVTFLSDVINVDKFPLTVLDRPLESETCKIVENSYRAAILAFMDEWSLFSERNGVDLIKVMRAIKVRPTHSNLIFPGPGIGGYCLPKDGGLGILGLPHPYGIRRQHFQDYPDRHRHQRHPRPARVPADPRCPAQHGQDRGRLQNRPPGGFLPRGRGRHPLQRLGDRRAQAHRNGGRVDGTRSVRETLVGVRETGHLPVGQPFVETLFPQPGKAGRLGDAEGYRIDSERRGCGHFRRAPPGVSGARSRCVGGHDWPAGGRHRLFRYPGRR